MSWNNSRQNNAHNREPEEHVRETVRGFRLRGEKVAHAMRCAAEVLGVSPRKVRSIYNSEFFRVTNAERDCIRDGFKTYLDRQARMHEEIAARYRARHREIQETWERESGCSDASNGGASRSGARAS